MATKASIRTKLEQLRLSQPSAVVTAHSLAILNRLVEYVSWQEIKNIHIYQSIAKLGEVDTKALIKSIQTNYSDINIYHPKDEPKQLDVVIVPLLAFDRQGNRIGMGGGYYDRFLKKYPAALKIGLAFELQKIENIPVEPHDVPLDAIITEDGTYTFIGEQ